MKNCQITQLCLLFIVMTACQNKEKQEEDKKVECLETSQKVYDSFIKNASQHNLSALEEISVRDVNYSTDLNLESFDKAEFIPERADGAFGIKKIGERQHDIYYTRFLKNNKEVFKKAILVGINEASIDQPCYILKTITYVKE